MSAYGEELMREDKFDPMRLLPLVFVVYFVVIFYAAWNSKGLTGYSGQIINLTNRTTVNSSIGGFISNGRGFMAGGSGVEHRIEIVVQLDSGSKVAVICNSGLFYTEYERCLPLSIGDHITLYRDGPNGWGLTP